MTAPIALAAGGTGGHTYPAEALAACLQARGHRVVALTDARTQAFAELGEAGRRVILPASSPVGGLGAKLNAAGTLVRSSAAARAVLAAERPACLVGFGSYAAAAASLAARQRRIPLVLHEQNAVLGRAHRLVARGATAIAASFAETRGVPPVARPRCYALGNPVRPAVRALAGSPFAAPAPEGKLKLLVLGGSQGARALATVIPHALARLPTDQQARLQVAHQVRPEDRASVEAAYAALEVGRVEVAPHFGDAAQRLADSHLAIARAGASTVAELAAIGRPAVLVPLPHAADDHQSANAEALRRAGAAWHLPQRELTAEALAARLAPAFADPASLARMAAQARSLGAPQAAERLADLLAGIAGQRAADPAPRRGEAAA